MAAGKLQDLSSLAPLTNLRYLDLHDCTALRDIHVLAQLPHLEVVHLEGCYQLNQEDLAKLPTALKVLKHPWQ